MSKSKKLIFLHLSKNVRDVIEQARSHSQIIFIHFLGNDFFRFLLASVTFRRTNRSQGSRRL